MSLTTIPEIAKIKVEEVLRIKKKMGTYWLFKCLTI